MPTRPRPASALGVARHQVSEAVERRPAILRSGRLRAALYLGPAVFVVGPLGLGGDAHFWAAVLLAVVVFCLVRAAAVARAYRRVRPLMDLHGYLGQGGRDEVRDFVSGLDAEADRLTLELVTDLESHARGIVTSRFWGADHMAPCRDLLDPFEVLRETVRELRYGTVLARVAFHCERAEQLGVISEALGRIDRLPGRGPVRTAILGLPLPASAGTGHGLVVEPVLAWAQAASILVGAEGCARAQERLGRLVPGLARRQATPLR